MNGRRWRFRPAGVLSGALAITFFSGHLPARGQERMVLSLDEALDRAGEHNPGYRQALNNLGLNPLDRRAALNSFLPTVSVRANTNIAMTRQLVGTDDFGLPIENPETKWRTSSGSTQSLQVTVPIYAWGVRFQQWKTQGAQARVREADVTAQLRGLHSGVVRAYRNAQNQRALLAAEEALLESRELDLETTRRRFELAGVSRVEVLQAELAVRQQELRIQEAQASLSKALLALRTQIGDPDLDGFTVAEMLPEPFDPQALDPGDLVSVALSSNPGIIRQEANLVMAEAQVNTAKGNRWTPISLNMGFSQSDNDVSGTGSFFDPYPDRFRGGQGFLSVGVELPVFPFRPSFTDPVERAEISLDNTQETLRAERLRLEEDVHARLIDLQVAYSAYVIAQQARAISEQSLELAQGQFRLGSRTFTELQINIQAAADAERAVIGRLFSFLQAQTNLEETVGVELTPAVGGAPEGPEVGGGLPSRDG